MIDMHAHCLPRITRDEAFAVDAERAPWLEIDAGGERGHIMLGDRRFRPVNSSLWDPLRRVAELDAQGVARAGGVRHAGDVRLRLAGRARRRLGGAHERARARLLRRRADAPEGAGPGAAAGRGPGLPRGQPGDGFGLHRRADRQPRRRARPGRRAAGAVPDPLRRTPHPGAGAPLGHDGRQPHEAVDAALAGGDAGRNPAGHAVAGPVGRAGAHPRHR